MAKAESRRLVIDASVARAAGKGHANTPPEKKACRDFLLAVLRVCHKVAMSPEVFEEWKNHKQEYAHTWLTSMVARKKFASKHSLENPDIKHAVLATATSEREREAMDKDLHLLWAAMSHDRLVVSLDENARVLFQRAAAGVAELRRIGWINPATEADCGVGWLEGGALQAERPLAGSAKPNRKVP
jgi:hypothetical protein